MEFAFIMPCTGVHPIGGTFVATGATKAICLCIQQSVECLFDTFGYFLIQMCTQLRFIQMSICG
jgi:hypothetical protein